MTYDPNSFVIRRPRHSANEDPQTRIWLEETDSPDLLERDVQLRDFSRKGAKLELAAPMTPNAEVLLHLQNADENLDVAIAGQTCWQRRVDEGSWLLGCNFEKEVTYEVIGELFLSGILEMHSRSC
jgi:hypothetical protein